MSLPQNPLPPMVSALRTRQESASSWKFVSAGVAPEEDFPAEAAAVLVGRRVCEAYCEGACDLRTRPSPSEIPLTRILARECRLIPRQPPAGSPSDPGGCFLNLSFSYKSRPTASSASKQQVLLNSMWFFGIHF